MSGADVDAICRLKHRYMRGVDTHDLDLIAGCFAEDASVWFADGKYAAEGRGPIMEMVGSILASTFFTSHAAIHPEIEVDGDRASGVWKLQTQALFMDDEQQYSNAGYYYDEYARGEHGWLIVRSGYKLAFTTSNSLAGNGPVAVETVAGRGA